MSDRKTYAPGPANVARVRKDGETWTLVLVRDLRHPPEKVWRALTEPAHLGEWAPFDASEDFSHVGTVNVTWAGTATPIETRVTRLTLWAVIDRRFISMGAAGWHIAFDVLERLLDGTPIGRIASPTAMQFDGWQRLNAEYAQQFGVELPK